MNKFLAAIVIFVNGVLTYKVWPYAVANGFDFGLGCNVVAVTCLGLIVLLEEK